MSRYLNIARSLPRLPFYRKASCERELRNYLTGKVGDQVNTLLAAAGYNLRKLLRWIAFSLFLTALKRLKAILRLEIDHQNAMTRPAIA